MKRSHFRKARFAAALLIVPWLFVWTNTLEGGLRLGIVLAMLGELVRLWANGYVGTVKVNWTQSWHGQDKVGMLVTGGPYAFVRNPLYFGSLLITAGLCVIAGQLWLSAVAVGAFLFVYTRKIAQEERVLADECGEAFARYRAAVPRLIPTWRRYGDRRGAWHWGGIWTSREWKTCIWVTIAIILLYFREETLQEHEALLGERWGWRVTLLIALCALIAADFGLELARRWRRRARPA